MGRTGRTEIAFCYRPLIESGAKATAVSRNAGLARLPDLAKPREASGLRRVTAALRMEFKPRLAKSREASITGVTVFSPSVFGNHINENTLLLWTALLASNLLLPPNHRASNSIQREWKFQLGDPPCGGGRLDDSKWRHRIAPFFQPSLFSPPDNFYVGYGCIGNISRFRPNGPATAVLEFDGAFRMRKFL